MKRYELQTDQGRKITWADSQHGARRKAEKKKLKVLSIREFSVDQEMACEGCRRAQGVR